MSKSHGRCDYCHSEMDWPPTVVPTSNGDKKFCDLDHAVHYFDNGPVEGEGEV